MAIKTRNRHLVRQLNFIENESVIIPLPQDNLLRRISAHGKIFLETKGTPGTGIKKDGVLNIVKRMQVRLNGSNDIFDLDLKTYFYALLFEYGTTPYVENLIIPNDTKISKIQFEIPIDFALIRNQISDFSALIPAHLLDSIELIITWGSISNLLTTPNDTTITTSSKITTSIIEVYSNNSNTKELDDIISNLTRIYEGVEQTPITKSHQSYPGDELPIQVRPVPARHLTTIFFGLNNITDGNPTYSNNVIEQIKLENVKGGGEAIFYDYFAHLNHQQKLDYKLTDGGTKNSPTGIIILDWIDIRNGSLDNIDVDALKYKLLTSEPITDKVNAVRIYKKYIPILQ